MVLYTGYNKHLVLARSSWYHTTPYSTSALPHPVKHAHSVCVCPDFSGYTTHYCTCLFQVRWYKGKMWPRCLQLPKLTLAPYHFADCVHFLFCVCYSPNQLQCWKPAWVIIMDCAYNCTVAIVFVMFVHFIRHARNP